MNRIRYTVTIAVAVAGCIGDRDVEPLAAHQAAALTDGRTFELMPAGATVPLVVEVGGGRTEDAHLDTLVALMTDDCEAEAASRFGAVTQPGAAVCSLRSDSLELQSALCEGHRWMQLAETVVPIDVFADGRVLPRRPLESGERTSELVAQLEADGLRYTVPVPTNNAAASFALLAVEAHQRASLAGARLLDPSLCPNGFLTQTVRADASGPATVSLAFVTSAATAESAFAIHEAANLAQERIQAAAQAHRSEERDARRATVEAWAGDHNSLMEASLVWLREPTPAQWPGGIPGVPGSTPSDCIPFGAMYVCDPPTTDPLFPIDVCRPSDAASDDDARDVLRATAIDPRTNVPDPVTGGSRGPEHILRDLKAALIEDFPEAFAGTETIPPRQWIERHTGTTPDAILRAAGRLVEDQFVRGRVIRPATEGARSTKTVRRVVGTSGSPVIVDPAYVFARTAGAARFDDADSLNDGMRDRGLTGTPEAQHFAPASYAQGGVLATLDAVRGALSRSLTRTDMGAPAAGGAPTDPQPGSPRWNAWTAVEFVRSLVPMRLQVAVGRRVTGGVDRVRLRLYGAAAPVDSDGNAIPDVIEYDVWLGEAGLACATQGHVEGESCNPADYRISTSPRIVTDSANVSGFGRTLWEWTLLPTAFPGRPTAISETSRIYITERGTSNPRSVVGITAGAGTRTGTYSRVSYVPAGAAATATATAPIEPSRENCDEPERCCGNVPCNLRVPLETELSEAEEGADGIESSFAHYLRVAREAADEADALGQELVQAGLEMDMRAEAARDQLEDICGGVVNVGALAPRGCSDANDCCETPPCEDGVECNNGICNTALEQVTAMSPDGASVAQCMGSDELTAISLGDRELCYYQSIDSPLPPCDCGATECPACPVFMPSSNNCADAFPELDDTEFASEKTIPMFKSVADYDGFDPPNCLAIAQLRNGHDTVDEILSQEWLSQTHLWAMGETLGTEPGLFNTLHVTRAGGTWLTTGSESDGPRVDDTFPCGPHDSLGEDDRIYNCAEAEPFHGGMPLLCGIDHGPGEDLDGCEDRRGRTRQNQRLFQATAVLAALGGASGRYLQRPGFRDGMSSGNYEVFIHDYNNPFNRPTGTGCSNDEGMCWVREHMSYSDFYMSGDLFFPRYCGNDDIDGEGCIPMIPDLPSGSLPLPVADVPGWFASQYVDGFIYSVIDGSGDGGSNSHALGVQNPNARCVFPASPADAETHMASGAAICPTYFTRVPASFEEMAGTGASRTDPMRLLAFWSKLPEATLGDEEAMTLRNFLEGVRDETLEEGGLSPLRLDEFPDAQVTNGQILDALELACISAYENGGGCPADLTDLPSLNSVSDFHALDRMLECAASRIEGELERMPLFDVPVTVAEDLASGQNTGTYPAYRGQYGETVAQLRGAIESVNAVTREVAASIRGFRNATQVAQAQLEIQDIEDQLAVNQFTATTSSQIARCVSAVAGTSALDKIRPGHWVAAGAECLDAAIQIGLAWQAQQLMMDINSLEQQQIYLELSQTFGQHMDSLSGATSMLAESYAELNGLLAALDGQRNAASREMARILFLDTDATGREYNVNRVMRARLNTLRERYDGARDRAVRLAWIARIALEQKLGLDLNDLTHDLTLVDAPAGWANTVCSMPGIDYGAIRDVTQPGGVDVSYANAFIGDYVDLLASVRESYPFDFPFTDGEDTTIVSLRDSVVGSRVLCDALGPNLLHHAADASVVGPLGEGGFFPECDEDGYCLTVTPTTRTPFTTAAIENDDGSFAMTLSRALGGAVGQRMQIVDPPEPPVDPIALPPRWMQEVPLPRGTYLLSWYERLASPPPGMDACGPLVLPVNTRLAASASGGTGELDVAAHTSGLYLPTAAEPWMHSCWRRAWVVIENPTEQVVRVGLSVRAAPTTPPYPSVEFAAPQLEAIPASADLMTVAPSPFFPTDDDLSWPVALCEDTYGDVFRAESWSTGCVELCPSGFAESCDVPATTHCYHEMQFSVDLAAIESGNLLSPGVFALGNYNYRTLDLAVNLVGVGVRDCELTDRPSECNASGFIPFSLRHDGPYSVRNHMGEEYDAPLFVGNIEHGRALTTERYLSNPIASADESLLSRYWRPEFTGRPMSGHYTLRVWDTPGLVWDRVRDVQIAIKYRYWTRFR